MTETFSFLQDYLRFVGGKIVYHRLTQTRVLRA